MQDQGLFLPPRSAFLCFGSLCTNNMTWDGGTGGRLPSSVILSGSSRKRPSSSHKSEYFLPMLTYTMRRLSHSSESHATQCKLPLARGWPIFHPGTWRETGRCPPRTLSGLQSACRLLSAALSEMPTGLVLHTTPCLSLEALCCLGIIRLVTVHPALVSALQKTSWLENEG